jgi:AcrR family transcriptional regulator
MTTRREAKAQTKQRLLDAMLEILHESGPLALTTGRIAERAGLAQPCAPQDHRADTKFALD